MTTLGIAYLIAAPLALAAGGLAVRLFDYLPGCGTDDRPDRGA